MDIIDGAWIFLAFIILFGVALMLGLYTRIGSGINEHPYARRYGDSPGADTDRSRLTGKDGLATISSRGTR
ncbi:MAG: hypothetical protein QOI80_1346 [Solirubrobacteraceae bacterium]|jgi:hypothetical protein|nr:hypothetical protein [Solirubrobacteraceae bacterium]